MAVTYFFVPFLAALMWIGFVAPAILRTFGVPMAMGFWQLDRRNQHLSRKQYVWGFGVFSWGIGMSLIIGLRALPWRLTGDGLSHSLTSDLTGLAIFLAGGWLVGSLGASQHKISNTSPR